MICDIDRGWLAGMVDGEGSVSITRRVWKGYTSYAIQISIGGTHEPTKMRLIELLEDLGCKVYVYDQKTRDPERHRQSWHVRIRLPRDVVVLSRTIADISTTKKDHWIIVEKFAESRLKKGKSPYTSEEIALYEASSLLNRRGPSE